MCLQVVCHKCIGGRGLPDEHRTVTEPLIGEGVHCDAVRVNDRGQIDRQYLADLIDTPCLRVSFRQGFVHERLTIDAVAGAILTIGIPQCDGTAIIQSGHKPPN